jgi:glucose/arabinose dehydrogenase
MLSKSTLSIFLLFLFALPVIAQEEKDEKQGPPVEADYYPIEPIPIPEGAVLEVGGVDLLPSGKLAVSTRHGEIYLIDGVTDDDVSDAKFTLFSQYLHEGLGLTHKDDWIYVTQRDEVTRLKDTDGDGKADVYETVADGWETSGDYHEYGFGSKFDKEGNIWVTLCLTGSFSSKVKFRGWCVRVTPEGETIPTCSGIRSPGGMGQNAAGDMFYTDNQGPWNGTCSLKHLEIGSFQGHPGGNGWYKDAENMEKVEEPKSGSRIAVEANRIPLYVPPPILFPYKKMGQSASGIVCDTTGGKFGPFENQMFVGDQTHSTVMRCFLEKVDGRYQGACFPFLKDFSCGVLGMQLTGEGQMFVGGTSRGWGSRGNKPYSLERVRWTGEVPFEVKEMRAKPEGFQLVFTKPVDPATAKNAESYNLTTYTYIFQASYGSPEVDHTTPTIKSIEVSDDGLSAYLKIDGLQVGHVHELHLDGVKNKEGQGLLHPVGYYTLNKIPQS